MACTDANFAYLRAIVFEQSFNRLDPSRDYLFESRLFSLVRASGFETLDSFVAALRNRADPMMMRAIAELMTVNETSFFRDLTPFELMRLDLLPTLIERRASSRHLRLWSAACSTGQEAYSLAMMLREHFPELREWEVLIQGTDVSAAVIARARAGWYQHFEVNRGLPARYLLKYMRPADSGWEIVPEVKSSCRFEQRNLCNAPMLVEQYDGILLRNVMLYFSQETRSQLLLKIHRVLAADGFLILGSGEQTALPTHFRPVVVNNGCYYKPMVSQRS